MFKMMCMHQNTCHYGSQVLVTVMPIMSVCCICACFLISLFFRSLFSEDLGSNFDETGINIHGL